MTVPSATIEVRAGWPGRVAEVHVAVGDTVTTDQELLTIESMKMLTPLTAPTDGKVAEILVAVDAFVDEGDVVVRLT
jgi:biotin carboxyl carrier protein